MPTPTNVTYFPTPAALRAWFRANHATAAELWLGFYKRNSGRPSVTWPESVDEALCVGWIDGIRKTLDADRYTIRFTPRRRTSTWSRVNIGRMRALAAARRVRPAGARAFAARRPAQSGIYSYGQRRDRLAPPYAGMLAKNRAAAAFFDAQPPGYRKIMGWWVVSAKKEETRLARLRTLIAACEAGRRLR